MSLQPHPLEELALSNMWGIAALVEVLERRGVLRRQEIYDAINALKQRHPDATTSERPRGCACADCRRE